MADEVDLINFHFGLSVDKSNMSISSFVRSLNSRESFKASESLGQKRDTHSVLTLLTKEIGVCQSSED